MSFEPGCFDVSLVQGSPLFLSRSCHPGRSCCLATPARGRSNGGSPQNDGSQCQNMRKCSNELDDLGNPHFRKAPNRYLKREIMRNNGIQDDLGGAIIFFVWNKAVSSLPLASWFTIRLAECWQFRSMSSLRPGDGFVWKLEEPQFQWLKTLFYFLWTISHFFMLGHLKIHMFVLYFLGQSAIGARCHPWIPGRGALGLCLAGPGHDTCRDGPLQRLQRWWTRPNRRQESDGILAGLPNHQRSGCVDFSPAKLGF